MMDFSKSTLQDLDSQKTGIFYNENNTCLNQQNLESVEKTRHKSNLIANGDKQNAMLFKYKQLDSINMHNIHNRKIITPVENIASLHNINSLTDMENGDKSIKLQDQGAKCGQANAICLNLCDKKKIGQLEDNILETSEITNNVEQIIGLQKEVKIVEEEETIEKIAEMIAKSNNDVIRNSKSKKRHQILITRNSAETRNINTDNETCIPHLKGSVNVADCNKKFLFDSSKVIDDINNPKAESCESSEDNILNKSRFEEIEDKLEEMFAGIEDEKLENITTNDNMISKKKSQIDDYMKLNYNVNSINSNMKIFVGDTMKYEKLMSLPTKAAKKSTNTIISNDKIIELNSAFVSQSDQSISNSMLYLKTMRKRHSMNKELLTCSEKTINNVNEKKDNNMKFNKESGMTSISLNPKTHKEIKKKTKYVRKSKIKNIQNNVEYKKDNKKVVNSRNNKKKCITVPNSKANLQKIKQHLSSENDTEEKPLHAKDIEIKHRSPFILVKNNGSITVINTVSADDSNEKCTRSKKTCNYIHERKTVKGCHSSTLSNRYDADTADSSWICVLCKIGPHKKGLGDLFGPYIISSDCEEYQCIKETDILHKVSNKAVKCINERSDLECKEENTINNNAMGMSKISDDCYEIWIHEECAIWAPNIFVVGSRLAGLEDVAWNSIRYECVYCLKGGALLCCLQRDCKITSHVPCAREFNWLLDESRFWVYCNKHVLNKF